MSIYPNGELPALTDIDIDDEWRCESCGGLLGDDREGDTVHIVLDGDRPIAYQLPCLDEATPAPNLEEV